MRKHILLMASLWIGTASLLAGCSRGYNQPDATSAEIPADPSIDSANKVVDDERRVSVQTVLDQLDPDYAFSITQKLISFTSNDALGYRSAGSVAEKAAAEMLAEEYQKIGLAEVSLDAFSVDAWEFTKAELVLDEKTIQLGGYATELQLDQEIPLVYLNQGTAADYLSQDVAGKLVLIDINQRSDWWINYPAYEAYLQQATAVIAVTEGYGEGQDDLIVAQDICGPNYAPALSISKKDADYLKDQLYQNNDEIIVKATIESTVTADQTSYNVVGVIPGKEKDNYLILGSHYDSYFYAFTDNTAAVAMNMAIAKAIVESGYQPQKTIIIIAHGAEEWGISNSKYDWASGSFNQINKLHPEWAAKTFAMINLDGVGYESNEFEALCTDYEYVTVLEQLLTEIPLGETVFQQPVEIKAPLTVMTDDFSYSLAGIPAFKNNPRTKDFSSSFYHTQYDTTENFYHPQAYAYQHQFYTRLLLAFDQITVLPLDFTNRFVAMAEKANLEVFEQAGINVEEWNSTLGSIKDTASSKAALVQQINEQGTASADLNSSLRAVFTYCQDAFVRLSWEDDNIFPYEQLQTNITALNQSIAALNVGEVSIVLDEYLYTVDNNWYAYDFSKETYTFFTDQVLEQDDDINQWGAGRVIGHVDLYDIIGSLQNKNDGDDVSEEIAALENILSDQLEQLKSTVNQQISDIQHVDQLLNDIQQPK